MTTVKVFPSAKPRPRAKDLFILERTLTSGEIIRDVFMVVLGLDGGYMLVDVTTGYVWKAFTSLRPLEDFLEGKKLKQFRGTISITNNW